MWQLRWIANLSAFYLLKELVKHIYEYVRVGHWQGMNHDHNNDMSTWVVKKSPA